MENELPDGFFKGEDGRFYKKLKVGYIETLVGYDKLPEKKDTPSKLKRSYNECYFVNHLGKRIRLKIDPLLRQVLDTILVRRKRGLDCVIIITGYSGSGKSVAASHTIGPYLNKDFKEGHVYFNASKMIEDAPNLPKNSTIILDESYADTNTRAGASANFLKLMNFLNTIRVKGHTIILILPDFFQLNSQLALFRSNFLLHVYIDKKTHQRGRLLVFDRDRKKNLYIRGKKFLNYGASSANFRCRFYLNKGIFDDDTYDKRKLQFLKDLSKEIDTKVNPNKKRNESIVKLRMEFGFTHDKLSEIFGLDRSTISKVLQGSPKPKKVIRKNSKDQNIFQNSPKNDQDEPDFRILGV